MNKILKDEHKKSVNGKKIWTIFEKWKKRYLNRNYIWTILKGEQKKSVNGKKNWTIFEKWKKRYLKRNYLWTIWKDEPNIFERFSKSEQKIGIWTETIFGQFKKIINYFRTILKLYRKCRWTKIIFERF